MKRLILLLILAGCTAPAPNATKADFERRGLKWPLTVEQGTLGCEGDAVFFGHDGTQYAVNGAASREYAPIEPIWRYDDKMNNELAAAGAGNGPKLRVNIGDMISEGLKLC